MQMAADQRNKRLNQSDGVGYKVKKKKKLGLLIGDYKMKSSISLEWDEVKSVVVSKKDQIGISRRDLVPFVDDVVCYNHEVLADVLAVPSDVFDFGVLKEILSTEVWEICLSEKDREFLVQFLPKGVDANWAVQELLSGDNFHFGNPFLRWSDRLCSGSFHPDNVVHHELTFKANKKAYYSECQNYHNDMIETLQTWKEKWASSSDPEEEIVQRLWRSRNPSDRNMVALANESSRVNYTNEQQVASSDSTNEKDLTLTPLHGESQRRKDSAEGKYDNSSDGLNVIARRRQAESQAEKLCKRNIQRGDGAKYMSYIKVSKEQHARVMSSMKNCGNSIQSRSLNHVLGNLDTFHVQPYEVFEEEERQKLHEHWLQLVKKHLPAGFANWRRRQVERQQMMKSLGQEIQEKVTLFKEDEEEENLYNDASEQTVTGESEPESPSATPEFPVSSQEKVIWSQLDNREADQEIKSEDEDDDEERPEFKFDEEIRNYGAILTDRDNLSNPQQQQPVNFPSEFQPLDLDPSDNNVNPDSNNFIACSASEEYSQKMNHIGSVSQSTWPSVSLPFYPNGVIDHQPAPLMDLVNTKTAAVNNGNSSFFNPNEDQRLGLLHSIFKPHNAPPLPYPNHRESEAAINSNHLMLPQFPPPLGFRDPSSLILRQKRLSTADTYLQNHHQNNNIIHENNNVYSQEQFMPLGMQDWSPHISVPDLTPPVSNHHRNNWFYSDNRSRNVWTGNSDIIPNPVDTSNTDQNLYSVISHCDNLGSSAATYDPMLPIQYPATNGVFMGSTGGALKSNHTNNSNIGWMNLPHQSTALQDSLGKPFLRHWNQ